MRREDFWESMRNMDDLMDFARENDLSCSYDVVMGCDLDSAICDDLRAGDVTRHLTWNEIRDALSDIDGDCEYYLRGGGWLEYNELTYEDFANAIVDEMDVNDLWEEDEEEEEEEEEEEDPEDEEEVFDFSFEEFAADVHDELSAIRDRITREEEAQREEHLRIQTEAQKMIDEAADLARKEEAERAAMLDGLLAS